MGLLLCQFSHYNILKPSFDFTLNGGENMQKNTVRVYDTIARKYVEVEVSEELRIGKT